MKQNQLLITVMLVVSYEIYNVCGLQCYKCDSTQSNVDCRNVTSFRKVNCLDEGPSCGYLHYTADETEKEYIYANCFNEGYIPITIRKRRPNYISRSFCETDLCNFSTASRDGVFTISLVLCLSLLRIFNRFF
uniref:(northern house mosquito) hypothetical protein n=1 Tax=Culex pipiens TaxID=7175 RepID=A0A8D8MGJ4_CULPI